MRYVVRLVMVVLALAVLAAPLAADSPPDTVRTTFQVEGMHCGDHEKGVAEAVYRPRKVEVDELKAEIEKLGYTVTGMETEAVDG